jgi:hypothetical protein
MTMPKRMTAKEFRELGYLQELNRQFLHPLGLALEIAVDKDTGAETFGQVWDARGDPEGIVFAKIDEEEARSRAHHVALEGNLRARERTSAFGWIVQPVDHAAMPKGGRIGRG